MTRYPARAKINLALHVTGLMDNGYHRLETLAAFAELADQVSVHDAAVDGFAVTGPFAAAVPLDAGNLVLKAREALRTLAGKRKCPPVMLHLDKVLPVASGLGGGSSDAAATLLALNSHWDLGLAHKTLAEIGAALGADVPMCLAAKPLLATGTGTEISLLGGFPALPCVLVNPAVPVSTPAVFDALASKSNPRLEKLPAFKDAAAVADWLGRQRNDLQAPAMALVPEIGETLAALAGQNPLLARMSGSGATCFGLFATMAEADAASAAISKAHGGWFCAATLLSPSGDVHGTH